MKENKVASALQVVGIIAILAGLISGVYYGTNEELIGLGAFQVIIGFSLFVNGVVWGIVFFGFSEVIKLLQGIFNQNSTFHKSDLHIKDKLENVSDPKFEIKSTTSDLRVSNEEREEIESFYASKGIKVHEIKATDRRDCFLVFLGDRKEIVELGGFKPVIQSVEEISV